MSFHEPRALGRTGLKVGRLGIAPGYGALAEAIEGAFERGCNYFTRKLLGELAGTGEFDVMHLRYNSHLGISISF